MLNRVVIGIIVFLLLEEDQEFQTDTFILQLTPGLSAHAADPKEAADSLLPLLEIAEKVVPKDMRQNTPVKVGVSDFYG